MARGRGQAAADGELVAESWLCHSEAETVALGRALARRVGADGVLLLEGPLGAGKTVLTRGVAEELGVEPDQIQSPTFTLVHQHLGRDGAVLYHLDLYRLAPEEVDSIGVAEILDGPGVKVVEWAERLLEPPSNALRVVASHTAAGTRRFEIDPKPTRAGGRAADD
jgi:tRNA threonylcarbamoyladenosine biosynthesis protein TsaE